MDDRRSGGRRWGAGVAGHVGTAELEVSPDLEGVEVPLVDQSVELAGGNGQVLSRLPGGQPLAAGVGIFHSSPCYQEGPSR